YCAGMSALLVDDLGGEHSRQPVILEGPLARSQAYCLALAAILGPSRPLLRSTDALEGTARGAWLLGRWDQQGQGAALDPVPAPEPELAEALRAHAETWRRRTSTIA
ncbi:hypothetical protein, partial [Pelomonas sp. KK5]|uniref:hypothetical protein n=1 Tax=Pelomonas sp. KK5 TaxID=1855730 RepID=UPI003513E680